MSRLQFMSNQNMLHNSFRTGLYRICEFFVIMNTAYIKLKGTLINQEEDKVLISLVLPHFIENPTRLITVKDAIKYYNMYKRYVVFCIYYQSCLLCFHKEFQT